MSSAGGKHALMRSGELTRQNRGPPRTLTCPVPVAASTVPEDTSTEKPPRRAVSCDANVPIAPKAIVATPPHNSQSPPKPADAPLPSPKSNSDRRRMIYTPTLVMIAKIDATGGLADA